jgi:hypothetical protein
MLAIAIAAFFSVTGIAAIMTIGLSVRSAVAHGRAIAAELAYLNRTGTGSQVIALPPLRSRSFALERAVQPRKAVMLRPMRRSGAAA